MRQAPEWIEQFNREAAELDASFGVAYLKNVYAAFRKVVFPKLTPLLAQARKAPQGQYAGKGLFFDVTISRHLPRGTIFAVNPPVLHNPNRGIVYGISTL